MDSGDFSGCQLALFCPTVTVNEDKNSNRGLRRSLDPLGTRPWGTLPGKLRWELRMRRIKMDSGGEL